MRCLAKKKKKKKERGSFWLKDAEMEGSLGEKVGSSGNMWEKV